MTIRKRAKRSRALAGERYQDWLTRQLPRAIPVDRAASSKYQQPGVYVVLDRGQSIYGQSIYVGETLNVADRVEQIINTEAWMNFGPTSVKVIDAGDQQMRYGLQSVLIGRTNPVLNSVLLRTDHDAAS